MNAPTRKVLIASPVRQKPAILKEFLAGLTRLELDGIECDYLFADDNDDPESSAALNEFMLGRPGYCVRLEREEESYLCDAETHRWKESLIQRVAAVKTFMLRHAVEQGFDHVFLVDSDIVLHPATLQHLMAQDKAVISEVFWTQWTPQDPYLPQTWLLDHYAFYDRSFANASPEQKSAASREFVQSMRSGETHRVGGLGACTLISTQAIAKGLSFEEIDNVSFWGEDRAFCIRARALGVELWADTKYPPLHLYREQYVERVPAFVARCAARFDLQPKVTLSMVVRNEADRYLSMMLQHVLPLIDEAVIIDDGSTDGTVQMIHEILGDKKHVIHQLDHSLFSNEHALRRLQWEKTLASNPDWILNLDADEILEPQAREAIQPYLSSPPGTLLGFRLFDFWSDTHYRDDAQWTAHHRSWPFMFRYTPDYEYTWNTNRLHTGRFPMNIGGMLQQSTQIRIKHLGWARAADREAKYQRYLTIDPEMQYCDKSQMDSILDAQPHLVPWLD